LQYATESGSLLHVFGATEFATFARFDGELAAIDARATSPLVRIYADELKALLDLVAEDVTPGTLSPEDPAYSALVVSYSEANELEPSNECPGLAILRYTADAALKFGEDDGAP